MKKLLKKFLLALVFTSKITAQTIDWGATQIVITNETQLREFASLVNGGVRNFDAQTVTLANDIDLGRVEWTPVGTSANPFKGVFEGGGFVIDGVFIDDASKNDVGLFGYSTGTIKNLGVIVDIKAGDCVGGLAGRNSGEKSIIENCFVLGAVTGKNRVGGLVGRNWGGRVKNSYAAVNVEGKEFGTGGLVGSNDLEGLISNSYAVGDVKGNNSPDSYVGKLVGSCYIGAIENSYALKNDVEDKFAGYYEQSTISQNSGLKTEVQMKQQGNFLYWDFNGIWGINANINSGFPHLLVFGGNNNTPIVRNPAVKINRNGVSFAGITNGKINLSLSAGNYVVELYNLQGRIISKTEINAINGVNATELNVGNLSKGVFILNVKRSGISVLVHKINR
jgi:hypothetical protein